MCYRETCFTRLKLQLLCTIRPSVSCITNERRSFPLLLGGRNSNGMPAVDGEHVVSESKLNFGQTIPSMCFLNFLPFSG